MARKSPLMNMTGEYEDDPGMSFEEGGLPTEDAMFADQEGLGDEDYEDGYESESDYPGAAEQPDVAESMMGLNALHREALQQADIYFNPVMDSPEIDDSERDMLNPASDPYAASMGLEQSNAEYSNRMRFKEDAIASLQSKAKTRALATAKFQDLIAKNK